MVKVTANSREAIDALENQSYHLISMDVQIPEMDGFEATTAIREKERNTGTYQPIVALTAHALKRELEHCLEVGMDGYLSKPIRPQELDEILENHVAQRMQVNTGPEATGQNM